MSHIDNKERSFGKLKMHLKLEKYFSYLNLHYQKVGKLSY